MDELEREIINFRGCVLSHLDAGVPLKSDLFRGTCGVVGSLASGSLAKISEDLCSVGSRQRCVSC